MLFPRLLIYMCLGTAALPASASGGLGWVKLANGSGASVDFPGGLFTNKLPSEPTGGLAFSTRDGRNRFELFSVRNSRGESPSQFARRAATSGERLDYKRITGNFIAASTVRNGRVLYRRCNFSNGMIHCIDLRYAAGEARGLDSTVTRISLSLRPR
jgi:hypothetical protein